MTNQLNLRTAVSSALALLLTAPAFAQGTAPPPPPPPVFFQVLTAESTMQEILESARQNVCYHDGKKYSEGAVVQGKKCTCTGSQCYWF